MTALFDEPVRAHGDFASEGSDEPCLWVGMIDDTSMLVCRADGSIETIDKDFLKADWRWNGSKWFDLDTGVVVSAQTGEDVELDEP